MTREEIIADEKYHTCGRCKHGDTPSDDYPCNECVHGFDNRRDFWELAESEEIMQFNTPTHEGYTERCNRTQNEGAYDE